MRTPVLINGLHDAQMDQSGRFQAARGIDLPALSVTPLGIVALSGAALGAVVMAFDPAGVIAVREHPPRPAELLLGAFGGLIGFGLYIWRLKTWSEHVYFSLLLAALVMGFLMIGSDIVNCQASGPLWVVRMSLLLCAAPFLSAVIKAHINADLTGIQRRLGTWDALRSVLGAVTVPVAGWLMVLGLSELFDLVTALS